MTGSFKAVMTPDLLIKAAGILVAIVLAYAAIQTSVARVETGQRQLTEAIVGLAGQVTAQSEAVADLERSIRDVREDANNALRDQVDDLKAMGVVRDIEIIRLRSECCETRQP